MATSEKFCLRWNDFESNISVAFQELREDKEFFDVTLTCDENQIQAHKVILSACSPFFRTILKRNKHEHPLLYLKGVKYSDIVAVLNFMYHGEVNVAQEELNSFLAVAEELKVKGLTQNNTEKTKDKEGLSQAFNPRTRDIAPRSDSQPPPSLKHARPSNQVPIIPKFSAQQDDDIEEVNHPIKTEPIHIAHDTSATTESDNDFSESNSGIVVAENIGTGNYNDEYADYAPFEAGYDTPGGSNSVEGNKDVDAVLSDYMQKIVDENQAQLWQCLQCGKTSSYITNIKDHIEAKHLEGYQFQCPECPKIVKTRASIRVHMKSAHNMTAKYRKQIVY